MNRNPVATEPQLVIVLKNTTVGTSLRKILDQSERLGEPLRVTLNVAGHEVKASLQVLNGPSPVFGGPRDTTAIALCAVEENRLPVQET
jgi:hypothetical protein